MSEKFVTSRIITTIYMTTQFKHFVRKYDNIISVPVRITFSVIRILNRITIKLIINYQRYTKMYLYVFWHYSCIIFIYYIMQCHYILFYKEYTCSFSEEETCRKLLVQELLRTRSWFSKYMCTILSAYILSYLYIVCHIINERRVEQKTSMALYTVGRYNHWDFKKIKNKKSCISILRFMILYIVIYDNNLKTKSTQKVSSHTIWYRHENPNTTPEMI